MSSPNRQLRKSVDYTKNPPAVDPPSSDDENSGPVLLRGASGPNQGGAGAKCRFLGERSLTIQSSWEDFEVDAADQVKPNLEHVEGMHHCLENVPLRDKMRVASSTSSDQAISEAKKIPVSGERPQKQHNVALLGGCCGVSCKRGTKKAMPNQDDIAAVYHNDPNCRLLLVADGHGFHGHSVSHAVAKWAPTDVFAHKS